MKRRERNLKKIKEEKNKIERRGREEKENIYRPRER